MKTREGNPIYPPSSPFRQIARASDKNCLCRQCVHLGDLCAGVEREFEKFEGFSVVVQCNSQEKKDWAKTAIVPG